MEVATTAQPPSSHQKRYVPIVAGTLGGCGLILVLGCLFYLFWRRRRQAKELLSPIRQGISSYRIERPTSFPPQAQDYGLYAPPTKACRRRTERSCARTAEDVVFGSYNEIDVTATGETPLADWGLESSLSAQGSTPRQSLQIEVPHSGIEHVLPFDINLEAGDPGAWDSYADSSSLGALPFANVDLETNFDLQYPGLNASTVPVSSDLEPSREEEDPLDIDLELGNPVDRDSNVYQSNSRALPFTSSDLQTYLAFDPQNSSPPNLQATSDLVPSRKDDFRTWCNNPSSSSHSEMVSNLPSAPSAPNTGLPNDQTLSPLRTTVEPLVSHPHSQAPQKSESLPLPLPPAPNLRCPNCPRKFSSRVRLE